MNNIKTMMIVVPILNVILTGTILYIIYLLVQPVATKYEEDKTAFYQLCIEDTKIKRSDFECTQLTKESFYF